MRYFTNNPLERMMMQKPKPMREEALPQPPKGIPVMGAGVSEKNVSVPATVIFRGWRWCHAPCNR